MDDLFVHHSRLLRLHLRRFALTRMSSACATTIGICRQRQLLDHRSVLWWTALAGLVGLAGRSLDGALRWGTYFTRNRHAIAVKAPAARRRRVRRRRAHGWSRRLRG